MNLPQSSALSAPAPISLLSNSHQATLMLIALNLIPAYGVLNWQWQFFDLIFLYWAENIIIGIFTVLRMITRPYRHPVELISPLVFAPFFTIHYGAFCAAHGAFLMVMFGPAEFHGHELLPTAIKMLQQPLLASAALMLCIVQMFEWFTTFRRIGFGGEAVTSLMTLPYRRIIVLHLGLFVAGFVLITLNEPLIGLLLLIAIKTGSDILQWRRDNIGSPKRRATKLSDDEYQQLLAEYPNPVLRVSGNERVFDNFADLLTSREYQTMQSLLGLLHTGKKMEALQAYFEMRVVQERTTNK